MNKSVVFTKIVNNLLTVCGLGNVLVTGESATECCSALWLRAVRAEHAASLKEALRSSPWGVNTVFCLDFFDKVPSEEETAQLLSQLYHAGPRYICIYVGFELEKITTTAHAFEQWARVFFEAGFRRHPRLFHALSYQDRECPPAQSLLCFERIPEFALAQFSLQRLHESRLLHMDMLRDFGRRSDAHLVRYFEAASFIRPGDAVLDCACGLGYGSYILYNNSRAKRVVGVDCDTYAVEYAQRNYSVSGVIDFAVADAQHLSGFADNSFDFIAGFETIEHVLKPEKYLRELFRVLRPSGRVMISAPDMWVDETGNVPNPHHFHVYTWDKLYTEISSRFIAEKGFLQIAGGAIKLPRGTRQWHEIPCKSGQPDEAEWVIMTAMKSPLHGRDVPYHETTCPNTENIEYHVGAFGRDYVNPWLVKGMVVIGSRIFNEEALQELQDKVIDEYPPDSVDYGAALCGKCYGLLSSGTSKEILESLFVDIEDYVTLRPAIPHVMRWQVSLLFVAALLRRKYGDFEAAEILFMRCAAFDVARYSPLLGNKTLDALHSAAVLALGRGDAETARKRLVLALEEAIRLAQGNWTNVILDTKTPFEPGFPEMAQLMDKAARACYALGEFGTVALRPGLAYSKFKGWYEAQAEYARDSIMALENAFHGVQRDCVAYSEKYAKATKERDAAIAGYENFKSWKLTVLHAEDNLLGQERPQQGNYDGESQETSRLKPDTDTYL